MNSAADQFIATMDTVISGLEQAEALIRQGIVQTNTPESHNMLVDIQAARKALAGRS